MRGQASFLSHFAATAAICILQLSSHCHAAATVSVLSPPASVAAGDTVTVNVQYSRLSGEAEQRIIIILEFRRSSDGSVVHKVISDNSGAGHTEVSKTVPLEIAVPPDASGPHHFSAFVTPWSMNKYLVTNYLSYPRDGTFTYLWSGGGYGVTQNCYYRGALICPKPAGNTTYCSGLAFEAFLLPYNAYNTSYGHQYIGNIADGSQMETFRRLWYGVTDQEKLSVRAIVDYNLGREITNWEEAQDGDFCQFWRTSGSGHNPVFSNWIRNSSGQIRGFRYWGSQGSTNGIGFASEYFSDTGGSVLRSRFYLGRVAKPRDQADYDWSIGQSSTAANPTQVQANSGVRDWDLY